jgi:hypothetical protein
MFEELPTTCVHCGRVNELHGGPEESDRPSPGDISVCWKCLGVSVFDANLQLIHPTPEQLAVVEAMPDFRQAKASMMESYRPQDGIELWRHMRTNQKQ